MPSLGSAAPYYGGGQVPNPANVTQFYSDAPEFQANLGSIAVNSTQETAFIAIAEDGVTMSGVPGRTVWAEFFTGVSPDVFPITPYVVGPAGEAGYQTIQSALTAANLGGGGVVYLQPGAYTEDLTWPLGVYMVCTEPTSFYNQVNITGKHTIVAGTSLFRQFGASQINFRSTTGSLFSGSVTGVISATLKDCVARVDGGTAYVFDFPSISSGSTSVFEIDDCTIISGGTLLTPAAVTLNVFSSSLSNTTSGGMTNPGGIWTFNGSSVREPIVCTGGAISATGTVLISTISYSGAAVTTLVQCSFFGSTSSCLTFTGTTQAAIRSCSLNSSNMYAIDGTSSGTLTVENLSFTNSAAINPALTLSWATASVNGALVATRDTSAPYGVSYGSSVQASAGTAQALINATGATANDSWLKIYNAGVPCYIPVWTGSIP